MDWSSVPPPPFPSIKRSKSPSRSSEQLKFHRKGQWLSENPEIHIFGQNAMWLFLIEFDWKCMPPTMRLAARRITRIIHLQIRSNDLLEFQSMWIGFNWVHMRFDLSILISRRTHTWTGTFTDTDTRTRTHTRAVIALDLSTFWWIVFPGRSLVASQIEMAFLKSFDSFRLVSAKQLPGYSLVSECIRCDSRDREMSKANARLNSF